MYWYNFKRKHGSIGLMTPMRKWKDFIGKQYLHCQAKRK